MPNTIKVKRGKSAALKLNMYCFNTDWRICSSDRKYKL